MFNYDHGKLNSFLQEIIRQNIESSSFEWLQHKTGEEETGFHTAFVTTPRKTGKFTIRLDVEQKKNIGVLKPLLDISDWPVDRLSRVWLLMNLDSSDQQKYFRTIETLFAAGEVNELVALYAALPVLAFPELWKARCAEGIRNNIGDVLQAIMCNNPYPSENLDEAAWNQLVLKAFFTEKPIQQIIGLDNRANEKLAWTLYDYAHERWSAHRTVNPQLWRCIEPFITETMIPDYHKIKDYVLQS